MAFLFLGATAPRTAYSCGWLRSFSFDLLFICGVAAAALGSVALVIWKPVLFPLVLMADMWLLGFHHVVSTFTRLVFDVDSYRNHRFLVLWLPFMVLAGVVFLVAVFGGWILPTVYFYWQWFHYTRQSYGIAQIYRRKTEASREEPAWLNHAVIYLLPLWGILERSWQQPEKFVGMPLKMIPVPGIVVQAVAVLSIAALGWWLLRQLVALWQGRLPVAYTLYILSHLAVFAAGYLVVKDMTYGWLTVNVWHNAQYILFVWMYNNNRFKNGVDPRHRFLSTLSQPRWAAVYFIVCVGISTTVYVMLQGIPMLLGVSALTLTFIVYQTINFHHYIVDGIIWKIRRPALRRNLGIAS
jgi:hypothetical protein